MDENLTTKETAAILRVEEQTLRMWRHEKRGPKSFKIHGRVLYARSDVEQFIADARGVSA